MAVRHCSRGANVGAAVFPVIDAIGAQEWRLAAQAAKVLREGSCNVRCVALVRVWQV